MAPEALTSDFCSAAARAAITVDTTAVYEGPEGTIVVPHTPQATGRWQLKTAPEPLEEESRRYNLSHIYGGDLKIIFLPAQTSGGLVLCEGAFTQNGLIVSPLPSAYRRLIDAARNSLKAETRKGFEHWIPPAATFKPRPVKKRANGLSKKQHDILDRLLWVARSDVLSLENACIDIAPQGLWKDETFVLEVIGSWDCAAGIVAPQALGIIAPFIGHALRDSESFCLKMIEKNPHIFNYLDAPLRNNRRIATAAALKNWLLLNPALPSEGTPESFRRDPGFVEFCLSASDELPFRIRVCGTAVYQPDTRALNRYQVQALERMYVRGDLKSFQTRVSSEIPRVWGDVNALFDPACTMAILGAQKAGQPLKAGRSLSPGEI